MQHQYENKYLSKIEDIQEEINAMKLKGNECFNKKKFEKAIKYYDKAIELDKNNLTVLANRSECFLKLGLFHSALADSNRILEIDGNNIKVLYRKARALENLNQFDSINESINIYKKLLQRLNEENNLELSSIIEEKLEKSFNKLENIKGRFKRINMLEEEKILFEYLNRCQNCSESDINHNCHTSTNNTLEFSCADYLNQKMTISHDINKGIHYIAKEDIKQGELLLVEKPLVFLMSEQYEKILKFAEENNIKISSLDEDFDVYEILLNKLKFLLQYKEDADKIIKNISHLYNKHNLKHNLEEREKNFFEFISNNSDYEDELRSFMAFNSIVTTRNDNCFNIKDICYGLWKNFSFLNHSCIPNAFYFGIGPYLILKSIKPIKKEEEITISYIEPKPFLERQFSLQKWEFGCNCELCLIEKNVFESEEYKIIGEKMEKIKNYLYENKILSYTHLKNFFLKPNEKSCEMIKNFEKWIEDIIMKSIDYEYSHDIDKLSYVKFLFFKSMAIIFSFISDDPKNLKDLKEDKIFLFEKAIRLVEDFSLRETYELLVSLRDSMTENIPKFKRLQIEKQIEFLFKVLYEI